jgi:hypothetical protein
MRNIQEISALISIRAFLLAAVDNLHIKLNREEIKSVQAKIPQLDKAIVEQSLKLDLTEFGKETQVVRQLSFTSVEEPEQVYNRVKEEETKAAKSSKARPFTKEEQEKLFDDTDGK